MQVLNLMATFSGSPTTAAAIDAYLGAIAEYSDEAVTLACKRFIAGDVPGQNKSFRPSAPELVEQVRLFANAIAFREREASKRDALVAYPMGGELPVGMVPLGPLEVDFGKGRIDMREMAPAEKEFVMKHQRLPPMPDTGPKLGYTSVGTDVSDD